MEAMNGSNDSVLLCVLVGEDTVKCGEEVFGKPESLYQPDNWPFWVYLVLYMVLVLFAGKCGEPNICLGICHTPGLVNSV